MRKEFSADLADLRQLLLRVPNEKSAEITPAMAIKTQKIGLIICGIFKTYT